VLDNATEAGRRLAGVVRESGLFTAFRQHLGFEVRFCNPYAGVFRQPLVSQNSIRSFHTSA